MHYISNDILPIQGSKCIIFQMSFYLSKVLNALYFKCRFTYPRFYMHPISNVVWPIQGSKYILFQMSFDLSKVLRAFYFKGRFTYSRFYMYPIPNAVFTFSQGSTYIQCRFTHSRLYPHRVNINHFYSYHILNVFTCILFQMSVYLSKVLQAS